MVSSGKCLIWCSVIFSRIVVVDFYVLGLGCILLMLNSVVICLFILLFFQKCGGGDGCDFFVVFGEVQLFGGGGFDVDVVGGDIYDLCQFCLYCVGMWVDFGLFVDQCYICIVDGKVYVVCQICCVVQEDMVFCVFLLWV